MAESEGLSEVGGEDVSGAGEVGDGAGDFDGFEVGTSGEIKLFGGLLDELLGFGVEGDKFGDGEGREGTIVGAGMVVASELMGDGRGYVIFYNTMFMVA